MSDASIKVMQLLDELEDILETASKVPFSDKAIVDSEEISQIISDIRLSMPKDIQQAQWVKDEQDRIINEAKAEYDKVIVAAKKQAEYLVETDVIKREAEKRAGAVIAEAESHGRYMKLRSYEYIDKMLYGLHSADERSLHGDAEWNQHPGEQQSSGNAGYGRANSEPGSGFG